MTDWHMKSARKTTGGIRTTQRRSDKRLAWKGGEPAMTTIAPNHEAIHRERRRGLGNTIKVKLKHDKYVIASEKDSKKAHKLEIVAVVENDADRQFARRNIITKGAVLRAKKGSEEVFVKVTNRPGQSGNIMGTLLEKFETKKEQKAQSSEKKEKKAAKAKKNPKKPSKAPEKAEEK